VLVQANYGRRGDLRIAGVPVGQEVPELMPVFPPTPEQKRRDGSLIVVVGTECPAATAPDDAFGATDFSRDWVGSGRCLTTTSGDIFIGFGTPEPPVSATGMQTWQALPNEGIDLLLQATVRATEESIVNALVAAETMVGANGVTVHALPHDRLRQVLRKYGRLTR
jgi:D-aminopeptidase